MDQVSIYKRDIEEIEVRAVAEGADADGEDYRIVEGILSTDTPYRRWYDGEEILEHGDGCDLSRIADGQGVVLLEHSPIRVIGRIESVTKQKKKLKVKLWIGGSSDADEVIRKLDNGLLKRMSVGYFPNFDTATAVEKDGKYTVTIHDWQPYEASLVSVPADDNARLTSVRSILDVGKPANSPVKDAKSPNSGKDAATDPEKGGDPKMSEVDVNAEVQKAVALEKERAAGITKLCREAGMESEADAFISDGRSLDDVKAIVEIVAKREKAKPKDPAPPADDGDGRSVNLPKGAPAIVNKRHKYDLRKAMLGVLDGYEKEVHMRLAEQRGISNPSPSQRFVDSDAVAAWALPSLEQRGFINSTDARSIRETLTRTITMDDASAGKLDPEPYMAGAFIELLRKTSLIEKMGYTILPGLTGSPKIPRQSGASGWSYITPDNNSNLAETTNPTYDDISMEIHVGYSRQGIGRGVMENSVPSIVGLVLGDLVISGADFLFQSTINGSGTGNIPRGILNASPAIQSQTGVSAGALTYENLGPIRAKLRSAHVVKADVAANAKWLFTGANYEYLVTKQKFAGASGGIINNGMIDGSPAYSYEGMPANTALYGDFSNVIVGLWNEGIEMRQSDHENGGIKLSAYMDHDIELSHSTALVKISQA